ncbi:MAG: inositol 2-dehydrogenase [Pseudomonadota bacterium]
MIRLAILGAGRIGKVHAASARALPDVRVVAVADAVPDAAAALATAAGATVRNAAQILAADDVDAIIIATPTDTHYDLIEGAAKAGKAIFCEKPIDLATERVRALAPIVAAAGVPFMTGFNRPFDPSFDALITRVRAGEIGAVEVVTITSRDPAPPPMDYVARSGGLFRDMMIHDFDLARRLLGEAPVRVQAAGSALIEPQIGALGDVDTAAVILTTASGKIAQIQNSRRATYGYDQRLEVLGELGMLRAENQLETTVERAGEGGFARAPARHFFLERYAEAYRRELAHFVRCLIEDRAPTPTLDDGLSAQILADAATLAWKEGRPIDL